MATSFYFQKNSNAEQDLLENLTIESIKINGVDVYYLPRTLFNRDEIFKEDVLSKFNKGYFIEVYVKNIEGFSGEKEVLSKFGIEIRQQVTFAMARRRFDEEIGFQTGKTRPLEGDLIYFPITQGLFEIKFVEHQAPFYQISERYVYELKCEKIEYSSERLDTGIPEIDKIETDYSLDDTGNIELITNDNNFLITEAGDYVVIETTSIESQDKNAQNQEFQDEGDIFIDFTERNPYSERI